MAAINLAPHIRAVREEFWHGLVSQHPLCLLQVGGVKTLGEPAIEGRDQLLDFVLLALLLPQLTQAYSRSQLPRFGLLAAGNGQGLLEARFGLGRIRDGLT